MGTDEDALRRGVYDALVGFAALPRPVGHDDHLEDPTLGTDFIDVRNIPTAHVKTSGSKYRTDTLLRKIAFNL